MINKNLLEEALMLEKVWEEKGLMTKMLKGRPWAGCWPGAGPYKGVFVDPNENRFQKKWNVWLERNRNRKYLHRLLH